MNKLEAVDREHVSGGLAASAVLVDLSISVWVGRKIDRKNTSDVLTSNHAKSSRAALVTKALFAESAKLEEISKVANRIRGYVASMTLPWMGDLKLLPMTRFLAFEEEMNDMQVEFFNAVEAFLVDYDVQVAAMAFKLGTLFHRNEYPTADEIRDKFNMTWTVSPLPLSGDFRVDAEHELCDSLRSIYQKAMDEKIAASMKAMWERLHECLRHLVDRLGTTDGRPNIFRDSMLENAKELVLLMKDFNITQDKDMEKARLELYRLISNVEPDELRSNVEIRNDVRQNVQSILDKFKF